MTRAVQPVTVFGGYRLMRVTWYRNADEDWDCDYEPYEPDDILYPTHAAALAALEANP